LVEFKQFATTRELSIKWQNLGGPPALDPRRYGKEIAQLAAAEIERVFATCNVDSEEQLLFSTALRVYQSKIQSTPDMLEELTKFVTEIEQYHPDQQGKFKELWPELSNLL
jgi:hypothetical protein